MAEHSATADDAWFVIGRWQQYGAEFRANLLRVAGIVAFYSLHLLNYHQAELGLFELGPASEESYHQSVTLLVVAWVMLAVGVDLCLRNRVFPKPMAFVTTACDVVFLTSVLCVGQGQRSPLVLVYLLIVILAALRLNVGLVRFATATSLGGYLFLMAYFRSPELLGTEQVDGRIARYAQYATLIGIALSGLITGQIVRRVRAMAEEMATRLSQMPSETTDGDREGADD